MPNETPDPDCVAAVRQLWDFLDDELTDERMAAVREHLRDCSACLPHAEFGERFLAALHETREDRTCPAVVRARVLEALRAAGLTGP